MIVIILVMHVAQTVFETGSSRLRVRSGHVGGPVEEVRRR
jgi:hypothetical protein